MIDSKDFNSNQENNAYNGPDPYSSMNPDFYQNPNLYNDPVSDPMNNINQNNYQPQYEPMGTPNNAYNDFPGNVIDNTQNQQNGYMNVPDPNFNNPNFIDPNMAYQNNGFIDTGMNTQNSNFNDPNMAYQDNEFIDPNMNGQNSNFNDPNMAYQNNGFNDAQNDYNMNGQNAGLNNYDMNSQNTGLNNYDMNSQNTGFNDVNGNYQQNANSQDFSNNSYSDDYNTEFVKTWMGDLYEKATTKKFNWCSLIFGEFYLLYRKMYTTGILFLLLRFLIIILLFFLITKIGLISLALIGVTVLLFMLIYGFGFYPMYKSFVKGKLNKYKKEITDNSQLINVAREKGGVSTIAAVVSGLLTPVIVGGISAVLIVTGMIDFKDANFKFFNKETNEDTENTTVDEVAEDDLESFIFTEGYAIKYDPDSWLFDEEKETLEKGNYVLKYSKMSIPNIKNTYNLDINIHEGRNNLLNLIVASYEKQLAAQDITISSRAESFSVENNVFYAYVDIEAAESASRYYLVLLPEDDILFQFVLSVNDTTFDYSTNLEVIKILTSLEKADEADTNTEDENVVDTNETSEDLNEVTENTTDENAVSENVTSENTTIQNLTVVNGTSEDEAEDEPTENTILQDTSSNTSNSATVYSNSSSLSDILN